MSSYLILDLCRSKHRLFLAFTLQFDQFESIGKTIIERNRLVTKVNDWIISVEKLIELMLRSIGAFYTVKMTQNTEKKTHTNKSIKYTYTSLSTDNEGVFFSVASHPHLVVSAAVIRFVIVVSGLLVAAVRVFVISALLVAAVRVFVVSALLVTAVVRFVVLVPSVVSASGKLGTSEVAVVSKSHSSKESEESEEKEGSEVHD